MPDPVNVDTLAPIPEIVRCWEKVDAVLPPADPTVPGDPSTNLATLAAIADAKWRRAEAAEAALRKAWDQLEELTGLRPSAGDGGGSDEKRDPGRSRSW